ncbi:MAG: glucose-1-phosphate thymidylyltransferase RfbA [Myxococcales bacterium]|nr:glucose-1-phosphate thymidylyltransferase RfbA [Myxococcales bacterium]
MKRKGILLAGGTGSRLFPATLAVSKQLLPVYDKPMVYYPLATLMHAGIRDIAVITTPDDQAAFQRLLGDGSTWGLSLTWLVQPRPEGLPQAYTLAEGFLAGSPSALVLGDNLFFGASLGPQVERAPLGGATVFAARVRDPERYGVLVLDDGRVVDMVEKPADPPSPWALTGLYLLDGTAPARAATLRPSARGELEITDLLRTWLDEGALGVEQLGRDVAWLDTGTPDALLDAASWVRTLTVRQDTVVACLEEIALARGWIDTDDVLERADRLGPTAYARYLRSLVHR